MIFGRDVHTLVFLLTDTHVIQNKHIDPCACGINGHDQICLFKIQVIHNVQISSYLKHWYKLELHSQGALKVFINNSKLDLVTYTLVKVLYLLQPLKRLIKIQNFNMNSISIFVKVMVIIVTLSI